MSLPMRERGLKYVRAAPDHEASRVAPHAGAWIEISRPAQTLAGLSVAPHAGAWIEIRPRAANHPHARVAPHAGAWIEIIHFALSRRHRAKSLPMRERGLKFGQVVGRLIIDLVAPHAGAWIEISRRSHGRRLPVVAPHAGAWIEISYHTTTTTGRYLSLPMRERGLK